MLSTLLAMEISMKIDAKILGGASYLLGCTTVFTKYQKFGQNKAIWRRFIL